MTKDVRMELAYQTTVTLTLTAEAAIWLKNVMKNPLVSLPDTEESYKDRNMRSSFLVALNSRNLKK